MRRFLSFWCLCVKNAFWGNTAFANDWQWVFGIPLVSGFSVWANARFGATAVTTGSPIADGFLGALGAFVVTWAVAFFVRLSNAPVNLYYQEKKKADDLFDRVQPRLSIIYDKSIGPCRDVVTYVDGSKGICFRLQVMNTGIPDAIECTAWLTKIEQMSHISPFKLFWIGSPAEKMAENLTEGVPRYLQVCEIRDFNKVVMATESRVWVIGDDSIFRPGEYTFDIVVKANGIKATPCRLKLHWTRDWQTAEVTNVEG
jgi:hypothetical protein